jgi:hypothetical protein
VNFRCYKNIKILLRNTTGGIYKVEFLHEKITCRVRTGGADNQLKATQPAGGRAKIRFRIFAMY